MRQFVYCEIYFPATKPKVVFNSFKESEQDVCTLKTRIQRKKGKNASVSSRGDTYGVESKLMLLACVDDADL